MIKNFVCLALAHILMPLIVTFCALCLVVFWPIALFDVSLLNLDGAWHSVGMVFWTVFALVHAKFAIDWWFVRDL